MSGGVSELVQEGALKASGRKAVWVRIPPPLPAVSGADTGTGPTWSAGRAFAILGGPGGAGTGVRLPAARYRGPVRVPMDDRGVVMGHGR